MADDYELMVVLKGDLGDSARENTLKEISELIEGKKGKVENTEKWGSRELAYKIKDQEKGFYTLISFSADNKTPAFLSSKIKLMEEILRHLIVKKGD